MDYLALIDIFYIIALGFFLFAIFVWSILKKEWIGFALISVAATIIVVKDIAMNSGIRSLILDVVIMIMCSVNSIKLYRKSKEPKKDRSI
jgi:hypothetical protein